jgi:hypothetical protein
METGVPVYPSTQQDDPYHLLENVPVTQYTSKRTGLQIVHARYPNRHLLDAYVLVATEAGDDSGCPVAVEHHIRTFGSQEHPHAGFLEALAARCQMPSTDVPRVMSLVDIDHTEFWLSPLPEGAFLTMIPFVLDQILFPALITQGEAFRSTVKYVHDRASQRIRSRATRLEDVMMHTFYEAFSEPWGLPDDILRLTVDAMNQYHQRWYRPCNMCFFVCGDIEPEKLFSVVDAVETKWLELRTSEAYTQTVPRNLLLPSSSSSRTRRFGQTMVHRLEHAAAASEAGQTDSFSGQGSNDSCAWIAFRGPDVRSVRSPDDIDEWYVRDLFARYLCEAPASLLRRTLIERGGAKDVVFGEGMLCGGSQLFIVDVPSAAHLDMVPGHFVEALREIRVALAEDDESVPPALLTDIRQYVQKQKEKFLSDLRSYSQWEYCGVLLPALVRNLVRSKLATSSVVGRVSCAENEFLQRMCRMANHYDCLIQVAASWWVRILDVWLKYAHPVGSSIEPLASMDCVMALSYPSSAPTHERSLVHADGNEITAVEKAAMDNAPSSSVDFSDEEWLAMGVHNWKEIYASRRIGFQVIDKRYPEGEFSPYVYLAEPRFDDIQQPEEVVIPDTEEIVIQVDYPFDGHHFFRLRSSTPGFRRRPLAEAICKLYQWMYAEETRTSTTVEEGPHAEFAWNRNTTAGRFGIWGHRITDLDLSGLEYDPLLGVYRLLIDS